MHSVIAAQAGCSGVHSVIAAQAGCSGMHSPIAVQAGCSGMHSRRKAPTFDKISTKPLYVQFFCAVSQTGKVSQARLVFLTNWEGLLDWCSSSCRNFGWRWGLDKRRVDPAKVG